ncbi:unnamed protein product [Didymodactylos carnosus]|uniref:Chitin-binding type-2 domain-containing protein n=2 Tax=Didymodactylos carnosus TaxID=1234261 RepID=A0A813YGU8_9BILA|nr:unnamed protein product [Didymodactylos carnosus]CAF3669663.1 unnamed protein product [Didymodactylos carnosus]
MITTRFYPFINGKVSSEFICPADGRWPDPKDCEKYLTCNSGISVGGWCGSGMAYDVDNKRCDLSKNIECNAGERPNWTPPENWQNDESVKSVSTKTTHDDSTTTIRHVSIKRNQKTTLTTKTTVQKVSSSTRDPMAIEEGKLCMFKGNVADVSNCASYFYCKEGISVKSRCPEKNLFDDDLKTCNDYRKVFCGDRPENEKYKDPCNGQPNGKYTEIDTGCISWYTCIDQGKAKSDDCPGGSRFNTLTLRCDHPRNIPKPCGLRSKSSGKFW